MTAPAEPLEPGPASWASQEHLREIGQQPAGRAVRFMTVAWPAFVMAGVLEMLVFAVVDPADLHWFGGELIGWSSQAVYTVTFMIFWMVIGLASGLSQLLSTEQRSVPDGSPHRGLARHWP